MIRDLCVGRFLVDQRTLGSSKAHRFVAAHLEDRERIETDECTLNWCWKNYIPLMAESLAEYC